MDKSELLKLIEDDDLGLLKIKPKTSNTVSNDERLVSSFNDINKFIDENGREPNNKNGIQERQLCARLQAMREDTSKRQVLSDLDKHGLLQAEVKEIKNLQDVFEDDDLDILGDKGDDIFTLKHVKYIPRAEADYIARRKSCKDFDKYKPLFKKVQQELSSGVRKMKPFNDKGESLVAGNYYILKGILLFLEEVDISSEEKTIDGKRYRKDGRTKCIFENGTESNMLYRSLAKELYKDGKTITQTNTNLNEEFYENMSNVTGDDEEAGYIYVLSSQSEKEEISSINNLYKIGFSNQPTEERIKNAENEPTYLMAPVKIVAEYKCFNMNPQKLELLLHKFFASSCIEIDIFDNNGKRHSPREWFVIPLPIIEEAIALTITGEIIEYKYDPEAQQLVERSDIVKPQ